MPDSKKGRILKKNLGGAPKEWTYRGGNERTWAYRGGNERTWSYRGGIGRSIPYNENFMIVPLFRPWKEFQLSNTGTTSFEIIGK